MGDTSYILATVDLKWRAGNQWTLLTDFTHLSAQKPPETVSEVEKISWGSIPPDPSNNNNEVNEHNVILHKWNNILL